MSAPETERLWAEVRALRARVEQLERNRGESPHGSSAPEEPAPSVAPVSFVQPERPTLESRIGAQWFNRVGIVALLVGAASFLRYAVDRHWLGPTARVAIGLAAGVALIAWSERFRKRQYPVFSFSLKAAGTGLLYLSMWAAFALFQLVAYPVAFAGMALITAGNAWMCWVQQSEVLAAFAAIGGFLTPALLASPARTPVWVLGSYLLLLNAGMFALLVPRRWPRLLPTAFVGTVGYLVELARGPGYGHADRATAFAVNVLFFVLFALAPLFTAQLAGRAAAATAAVVALGNAAAACCTLWLLPPGHADLVPAALAGFYAGLILFSRSRPLPAALAASHAALWVILMAVAAYSNLSGGVLVLGLAAEIALLLPLTLREDLFNADAVLRSPIPAAMLLVAASATLLYLSRFSASLRHAALPVVNVRAGLYLLLAGVSAGAVRAAAKHHALAHRNGEQPGQWAAMGAGSAVLATLLLLVGGVLEIHAGAGTSFYVSAWAAALGAALLLIGFRLRWAFLRWLALGLLTLAVGKVFLFDTRSLSQGYHILSFIGLGVLLLAVSFVYQRDLLHLRGEEHES